jgi:hypothetical protein
MGENPPPLGGDFSSTIRNSIILKLSASADSSLLQQSLPIYELFKGLLLKFKQFCSGPPDKSLDTAQFNKVLYDPPEVFVVG